MQLTTLKSFAAAALIGSIFCPAAARAEDDDAKLKGYWQAVAIEQDGTPLDAEAVAKLDVRLRMGDGAYRAYASGKQTDQGSYEYQAGSPPGVDILSEEGPLKGKKILAIYKFEGDSLVVCYSLFGGKRPKDFDDKTGPGRLLITYGRVAE